MLHLLVITICLLGVLFVGMPVGFALGGITLLALWLFVGSSTLPAIANITWGAVNEFVLTAVPLFLLMSEIISFTGMGKEVYECLEKWLGRLPGGLAIASVMACALFGAVSGTGVGVAAIVGGMAIPEMLRRGYSHELAAGSVAASSALGMVIPPSLPLIVYGVVTELSVGKLFMAGIIPGIMVACIFSLYILAISPKHIKKDFQAHSYSWKEKFVSLWKVLPILALILVVLGGIYVGFTTPTESAGVGAVGAMIIAAMYRKLNWKNMLTAITNATKTSAMILTILIGAMLFGYLLGILQIPQTVSTWVVGLDVSRWVIFAILMVVYLFLGMFLEVTSIILITIPIVYPIIIALKFDPIWFAIVLMVNMCAAVVTPPVGLCAYVVKNAAPEIPLATVFKSIVPYVVLDFVAILVLILFPQLTSILQVVK